MLQIEHVLDLPQGQDFYLRQDNKSDLWIYTVQDGVAKLYKAPVTAGNWDSLVCTEQTFHTFEKDLTGLIGNEMDDVSVIVYTHNNSMSILKMPADTNRYVYDDTYRLYWAVDSRKLYMNIAKNWEMIGTLRHELMENIGTLSHDEIEAKLNQIEETLGAISSAVSTLNGMNGDVTLAQGDNVTITKDAATKKLTVASKDTVTTVNSLQGSVILEAGDNVAISQPTGTNKLRITASGGGAGNGTIPSTESLSIGTWSASSRLPKVFGGAYIFQKDVEIKSVTCHDTITNMTDAVLLVIKEMPFNILNALITGVADASSTTIDVASTPGISQIIPVANMGNVSIKVKKDEPVIMVLYSPGGFTPSTLSFGTFNTNTWLKVARCMVAANGNSTMFITSPGSTQETYSLEFTVRTDVASEPIKSGLVTYYDIQRNNGTKYDSAATVWKDLSGSNNDATLVGATWDTKGLLTNTSKYAKFARTVATDFTIEFTFKAITLLSGTTASSQWWYDASGLVSMEVGGNQYDFGAGMNKNGQIVTGIGHATASSDYNCNTTMNYNNGQWHTVALVRNTANATWALYVDGVLINFVTTHTVALNADTMIAIGATMASGYNYINAYFASLRVYNRALTDGEIKSNALVDMQKYNS